MTDKLIPAPERTCEYCGGVLVSQIIKNKDTFETTYIDSICYNCGEKPREETK